MNRPMVVALVGSVVAITAFLTYFLVVPRWPDLRDSGVANVVIAVVGSAIAVRGWAGVREGRWKRALVTTLAITSFCMTAFLATYVFYLSWQLPAAAGSPRPGQKAPPLVLEDSQGQEWDLSTRPAARWLVLDFFRGHW